MSYDPILKQRFSY